MYIDQADCQIEELSSSYHPFGMLDRDQRTTKMLPKSFKYNSNSKLHQQQIFNNSQNIVLMRQNSQNHNKIINKKWCSHDTSNFQSVNTNQINGDDQKIKSVLVDSKNNCKNNIHCHLSTLNDDCGNMINQYPVLNKKTKFSSYKSISKLSNLLFCVCFWLLIMEKTCAAPTVTTYGQKFDPVHSLAKLYFGESLNILKDYCKQHLNCNTSSAELWRQKNFDFISPKNQPSPFTFHDYSDGTDVHINVTDEASAIDTLKTISRSVLILDAAFHHITEKDRVDCFNSTYYNKVMQIINQMKEELESVLRKLEIKEPDFVPLYFGTENKEVRDWVVLREYLKLMTYIKKVFPALEEIIFNGKHT